MSSMPATSLREQYEGVYVDNERTGRNGRNEQVPVLGIGNALHCC